MGSAACRRSRHCRHRGRDDVWCGPDSAPGRRRDALSWDRERKREEQRSAREDLARTFEQRRIAYVEALTLIRLLLSEESVSLRGEFFTVESASIGPRPARPLDIWLGGSAPGALRRGGRLGDGWLASFLTPAEAEAGRRAIEAAAAEVGREIEPDHYGISLAVADDASRPALLEAAARSRRPDVDPEKLIASGWDGARALVRDYVAAGLTKFVIRPGWTPVDPDQFTADFVREMVPLQT